jgi:hypothetical protein
MVNPMPATDVLERLALELDAARRSLPQSPATIARRQPVHTVYGGAHLFRSDTAVKLGALATRALEMYAPDARALERAIGPFAGRASAGGGAQDEDTDFAEIIHARVRERLRSGAVDDFRIDFEDGYGVRADEEEDAHARSAALEVARAAGAGTLPRQIGIRVKPVTDGMRTRSVRTLDIFVTTLADEMGGRLPDAFVLTLPKVTIPAEAGFFAGVLELLERRLGLGEGTLVFEFMVETPQIVLDAEGRCPLPRVVEAARGRAIAAHFGTYDYTAACGISAAHQRMRHPACDHARHVMQVALADSGVFLSDGSTAVLPVPPHRGAEDAALSDAQHAQNEAVVHRAWRMHYEDVRDSLARGFYQGWDLHPAQLVTRYAAVYAFFLEGADAAAERLRNFIDRAARATLVGEVFDDAATAQGLLNYFRRALSAGALTEEEVVRRTALGAEDLRRRSFAEILRAR